MTHPLPFGAEPDEHVPLTPPLGAVFPPPDSVIDEEIAAALDHAVEALTGLRYADRGPGPLYQVTCALESLQRATERAEGALAALRLQETCGGEP